jgi:hypothetical protein
VVDLIRANVGVPWLRTFVSGVPIDWLPAGEPFSPPA